jgi:hypothetical protein
LISGRLRFEGARLFWYLWGDDNLETRRALMSLFFVETPTYNEIVNGTPKLQPLFKLSEAFKANKSQLVTSLLGFPN